MRSKTLMVTGAVLAMTAAGVTFAVSGRHDSVPTVNVTLKEFSVAPQVSSAAPGKVTFRVTNTGSVLHEFVVLRTPVAAGHLHVSNGSASEAGSVGEVADLKPGATGSVTLTLQKGHYALICNQPGHYMAGQRTDFVVR